MKKRMLSGLLALVLVLSLVPFGTLAEDVTAPDESVTEATEVTETTQATEPAKATEPTQATEPAKAAEPTKATEPVATTEPTDATEATDATETTAATETTEPTVPETTAPSEPTAVEKVQSLIDALPEIVTEENRAEVENQLTAIDDAKLALSDAERDALDFGKYNAAIAELNALEGQLGAEKPEAMDAYSITFDANGGKFEHGETSRTSMTDPDGTFGYGSLPTPVWDGYNFVGWYTANKDGDLVTKDTVFVKTGTIYAHWEKGYTITLDANGGTVTPASVTTDADGKLATLPTPTKSSNAFLGWYSGETKWGTDSFATENITLTAKWSDGTNVKSEEELKACVDAGISTIKLGDDIALSSALEISGKTLTLDLNGHELSKKLQFSTSLVWVKDSGSLTIKDSGTGGKISDYVYGNASAITLESGTVEGILEVSNGSTFTMNGGAVNSINANATVYANGGKVNNYISLKMDGIVYAGGTDIPSMDKGSGTEGYEIVTCKVGEKVYCYTFKTEPTAPKDASGYPFLGWYTEDGKKWDFGKGSFNELTVTAKFNTPVTTEAQLKEALAAGITDIKLGANITLSGDLVITQQNWNLELNGHTLSGDQIKFSTGKMTVTDSVGGGSVNNSIALTSATLSGTVFKDHVNCVMNSTIDGGAFYGQVNLQYGSDVKNGLFYAQDSFKNATTTGKQVVFKLNGSFLRMEVTTGTATEPDVAKTGYTFTGWCRDAECKGDKWDFTKTVSENMTLYGKSEITTYTITYDKGADDATGTIANGTKEYGKDFKLNVATYTRKGYIQLGWYDKENEKTYYGGDVYKENADLYLTAIWEKEVSYTIPFTKTVKQNGSTKPGSATFSLYICGVEDIPEISGNIDCDGKVTTKGTGNFTGELTISGSENLVQAMLCGGIYVQEWDSEMDKWTYDNHVYFLRLEEVEGGYQLRAYTATAKTVDKATVYSHGSTPVKMAFTNTYGTAAKADTSNPKTGDTIYIAAATMLLSAMALIAILPRKKRM